jgi:hypothetical protein
MAGNTVLSKTFWYYPNTLLRARSHRQGWHIRIRPRIRVRGKSAYAPGDSSSRSTTFRLQLNPAALTVCTYYTQPAFRMSRGTNEDISLIGADRTPLPSRRHRCSAILRTTSAVTFRVTVSGLHSCSAAAAARGQTMLSKEVLSTHSDHFSSEGVDEGRRRKGMVGH